MDGAQIREWEQIRASGREQFVLREGILKKGIRDASILLAIWFAVHVYKRKPFESLTDLLGPIAGFCIATLIAGWIEGNKIWEKNEKEYEQSHKGDHPV